MEKKFYTIYKITNLLNGRYYIGSHITKDPDDRYYGSGNLIVEAIQKYGIDNFKKEILFFAFSKKDMEWAEEQLVVLNEDDSNSYNLIPGGNRPPSKKNKTSFRKGATPWNKNKKGLQTHTEEWKKKQSEKMIGKKIALGKTWERKPLKETWKWDEESKRKHSLRMMGKKVGSIWINNGLIEKMIKKNEVIPDKFVKGRL